MSVLTDFISVAAPLLALIALGAYILRKQSAQRIRIEDDDDLIFIALCETRTGAKTHYHIVEDYELNYTGYPIKGHPTLCGAEVGWDMRNQEVEATCETCLEALENLMEKYGDRVRFVVL